MGDMDAPVHFRRSKQSTDEWYQSTLDAQVRARWKSPPKNIQERAAVGNRLAGLYGANTSSKMIRKRASRVFHSPVKSAFNSPASQRRSTSPSPDRTRMTKRAMPSLENKSMDKKSSKPRKFIHSESLAMAHPPSAHDMGEKTGWSMNESHEMRAHTPSALPPEYESSTNAQVSTPGTPGQLSSVMMESVQITPSSKKKSNDPNDFSHISSKVSPMPKHPRQKFKGNGFKGFYVGKSTPAPGSPMGAVPRYGFQGVVNLQKKKHPHIMSPVGRVKDKYIPKALNSISRTNVYSEPFSFKPTRDWPAEAFNLNSPNRKGEITARDTRGLQFEDQEVRKLYKFAKTEKMAKRAVSRQIMKSSGLDKFNADGTPRRNALKHLGSVGKLNLSMTKAWGGNAEEFPESLFEYMRQKKWERSVYHDDLHRAYTAKFDVSKNSRKPREEMMKDIREKQKKAEQRAKTVGPLVYRNEQGRITKTANPGVRLTEKLVQPVTRMKYWTSLTAIYASRDTTESSVSAQEKQKAEREARLNMKWKELLYMHKVMRLPATRTKGNEDIDELLDTFKQALRLHTDPHICDRDTFVKILTQKYAAASFKHLNRLFSAMDIDRTNQVDYRDFVAALRIFRRPTERTEDKLANLFKLYDVENTGGLPKPEIKQILYTCAVSEEEKKELDEVIDSTLNGQSVRSRRDVRPSFLGLAYVGVSGCASALGGMASFGSNSGARSAHVNLDKFLEALKEDDGVFETFQDHLVRRLEGAKFEGRPFNYTVPHVKEEEPDIHPSVGRFNNLMGVSRDNHIENAATV